jgi:hypothetical protein
MTRKTNYLMETEEEWQNFCRSIHQSCNNLMNDKHLADITAHNICAHESWRWINRPKMPTCFVDNKAVLNIIK